MNFRHIRYFLAVAEELSFTVAARRLCIAQPPLSRQIRDLEEEIGAPLFTRQNGKISLTPAGLKLQEEAYGILDHCQAVLQNTRAIAAGGIGVISIGYMPVSFCYKPFLDALKLFRERYPRVKLTLTQMSPVAQLEALKTRRIDFGILHIGTALDPELEVQRIFDEPIELLFPAGHRVATQSTAELEDVADEPFIMMARRWCPSFHDAFLQIWRERGYEPNIVQETESFAVSLSLVANGMGITVGSATLRKNFTAPVQALRVNGLDMRMGADLVWAQARATPAMERFVEAVRDCSAAYAARGTSGCAGRLSS